MRVFAVVLAVAGIAIAAANVWALFIPWLSVLGILVPPIGAVMIADLYVMRRDAVIAVNWRPRAFVAWAVGSLVAFGVENFAPQLSTAVAAFLAGGACYLLMGVSARAQAGAVAAEVHT